MCEHLEISVLTYSAIVHLILKISQLSLPTTTTLVTLMDSPLINRNQEQAIK